MYFKQSNIRFLFIVNVYTSIEDQTRVGYVSIILIQFFLQKQDVCRVKFKARLYLDPTGKRRKALGMRIVYIGLLEVYPLVVVVKMVCRLSLSSETSLSVRLYNIL